MFIDRPLAPPSFREATKTSPCAFGGSRKAVCGEDGGGQREWRATRGDFREPLLWPRREVSRAKAADPHVAQTSSSNSPGGLSWALGDLLTWARVQGQP